MAEEINSLYPYNHPKSRLLRRMIELYGKTEANSILEALPDGSAGGAGGFVPKGAVSTVSNLPSTGNEIGDIYIVTENGSEYVWITSETNPNGYWEELGQTIDLSAYELKPTVNSPAGAAVTITPVENSIYNCGTLTSLTISNPPATGAYSIVFTSGSTATTTTFPSTILGLESFAADANTIYEINVLDNRAVVGKWAVSA